MDPKAPYKLAKEQRAMVKKHPNIVGLRQTKATFKTVHTTALERQLSETSMSSVSSVSSTSDFRDENPNHSGTSISRTNSSC